MKPFRFPVWLVTLVCLMGPATLSGQSEWIELASEHFVLHTDTGEEKGRGLLGEFEARYEAYSDTFFPLAPRESPIRIVLMDETEAFERFIPEWAATSDAKSAYLIQGVTGTFILARDRSPDDIIEDVGHSLGHLLLSRSVLWQPFWLQEGVGEYLRRLGRGAGGDAIDREDGFGLDDLFTIVPSEEYDDLDDEGDFRKESYHVLRILLAEYPEEFRAYFSSLGVVAGVESQPAVDLVSLEEQVFQYEDSPLVLPAPDVNPLVQTMTSDAADAVRGDLALAAGLENLARTFYQDSSAERARVGMVLLRKVRGETVLVRTGFEQLVEIFPDSGLTHFHHGILTAEDAGERVAQIAALERAIELMPTMGRAYAELAWLHVQDGRPRDAIPLIERAIRLEPEFADRSLEILAEAWLSLGDYAQAEEQAQLAAALPHSDRSSLEHYERLVPEFYRKIELHRRASEAARVEALRRELEKLVEEVDPRPDPPPVAAPAPIGRVTYSISSGSDREVSPPQLTRAPMPDYAEEFRRRGLEGRVVLAVDLDRRGRVIEVRIEPGSDPELAAASVGAVEQWAFLPARRGLVSSEYSFRLTLRFYLE